MLFVPGSLQLCLFTRGRPGWRLPDSVRPECREFFEAAVCSLIVNTPDLFDLTPGSWSSGPLQF